MYPHTPTTLTILLLYTPTTIHTTPTPQTLTAPSTTCPTSNTCGLLTYTQNRATNFGPGLCQQIPNPSQVTSIYVADCSCWFLRYDRYLSYSVSFPIPVLFWGGQEQGGRV
ncbi:hypothetical protein BDW02DRAFT_282815 [Decorospora gaudefroyi]|uniref:Uncharacterized protein n=1 Tax=Decorospora gaudefroyi TaxID=184978 RepID=A0A6A5KI33_9PLEO|nr:hypothetical protein BDW02DRAFT_282815 [Decorospora gaudefroyi]